MNANSKLNHSTETPGSGGPKRCNRIGRGLDDPTAQWIIRRMKRIEARSRVRKALKGRTLVLLLFIRQKFSQRYHSAISLIFSSLFHPLTHPWTLLLLLRWREFFRHSHQGGAELVREGQPNRSPVALAGELSNPR